METEPKFEEYANKQLMINNRLLVLIGEILLEVNQDQIKDKIWHKWDARISELKRMID